MHQDQMLAGRRVTWSLCECLTWLRITVPAPDHVHSRADVLGEGLLFVCTIEQLQTALSTRYLEQYSIKKWLHCASTNAEEQRMLITREC